MQPSSVAYPATFEFDAPEQIARWRPLVSWLLVFPHLLVLYVMGMVSGVCALVAWFAVVFTGAMPEGLTGVIAMTIRYQTRVYTYAMFLREEYPPFTFDSSTADPGDDPRVRVNITPQLTDRNRVTVFFRYFMVLPHALVLAIVGIGVFFAMLVASFAVLFTGRWPEGPRDLVLGYLRWTTRLSAYSLLLTDEYPPFSTA